MGDARAMAENNGGQPFKTKPKYRAKLWAEKPGDNGLYPTTSCFVWSIDQGNAQVSDEIDTERYYVYASRLSSIYPLASSWV